MTITLSSEVRSRLDAHLDAVERALVETNCSRERRRGIVDDLEAQILEMLEGKGAEPTVADLEGILAGLDPPTAYRAAAEAKQAEPATAVAGATPRGAPVDSQNGPGVGGRSAPATQGARLSRMAVAGFICILASKFCAGLSLLLLGIGMFHTTHSAAIGRLEDPRLAWPGGLPGMLAPQVEARNNGGLAVMNGPIVGQMRGSETRATWAVIAAAVGFVLLPVPLALIGTILGWLALSRIRASNGLLYGRGLALFDGLFYPLVCVLFLFLILPVPMILVALVAAAIVGIILLMRFIPARA